MFAFSRAPSQGADGAGVQDAGHADGQDGAGLPARHRPLQPRYCLPSGPGTAPRGAQAVGRPPQPRSPLIGRCEPPASPLSLPLSLLMGSAPRVLEPGWSWGAGGTGAGVGSEDFSGKCRALTRRLEGGAAAALVGPESLPSVSSSAEGQAGVKLGSPSGDSPSPGASVSRSVCEPTTLPAQAFPVGSLLKSSIAWLLALLYLLGSRLGVAGGGREVARAGTSPGVGGPGAQLQRSLHFLRCPGPQPQWHSRWARCPSRDVGQPGQGRCGGP